MFIVGERGCQEYTNLFKRAIKWHVRVLALGLGILENFEQV